MSRFKRGLKARRAFGFHADHFDIGLEHLGKRGYACGKSAAAHGDQNNVHKRQVLDDLHGDRSLSGGHIRVVKRMDKGVSVLLGKL